MGFKKWNDEEHILSVLIFAFFTSIFSLISRGPQLRNRQVGVIGCARGDVGAAVVRAVRSSAGHVEVVPVRSHVCWGEGLLPLEQLQPLLHLPLELLVLQLLLPVNALKYKRMIHLEIQNCHLLIIKNCEFPLSIFIFLFTSIHRLQDLLWGIWWWRLPSRQKGKWRRWRWPCLWASSPLGLQDGWCARWPQALELMFLVALKVNRNPYHCHSLSEKLSKKVNTNPLQMFGKSTHKWCITHTPPLLSCQWWVGWHFLDCEKNCWGTPGFYFEPLVEFRDDLRSKINYFSVFKYFLNTFLIITMLHTIHKFNTDI